VGVWIFSGTTQFHLTEINRFKWNGNSLEKFPILISGNLDIKLLTRLLVRLFQFFRNLENTEISTIYKAKRLKKGKTPFVFD